MRGDPREAKPALPDTLTIPASTVVPPRSRRPVPAAAAIPRVEAATPTVPSISGRVAKGPGEAGFMPQGLRRIVRTLAAFAGGRALP